MIKLILYCIFFLIFFLFSCAEIPEEYPCDKTKDPDCDGYNSPEASFTNSPNTGEILDNNNVSFSWSGNQKYSEFSYKMQNSSTWSDWSVLNFIKYNCLADGEYRFYVKEKYPNGDEQSDEKATSVFFIINHIKGPGIVLNNQCIESTVNSLFDVYVTLEDITNEVVGAKIVIQYENNLLRVQEVECLSSVIHSDINKIVWYNTNLSDANLNGQIEISLARFDSQSGENDSNRILRLSFKAVTVGNTEIILDEGSVLRDNQNESIEITELINCNVEIQ